MAKKPRDKQNSKVCTGWMRNKLSDFVSELESGVSVSGEGRPAIAPEHGVLKVSAVSKGRFVPQQNKAILPSELERARFKPKVGAILVSRSNTPELVGESARIRSCPENFYLPDKLWQIVLMPSADIDEGWLAQILFLPSVRGKIRDRASGSSRSMYNISTASFLDSDLLVPPYREQVRIAETLANWDDALEKLDAMVAAKRQMKQGLMQQLLSASRAAASCRT